MKQTKKIILKAFLAAATLMLATGCTKEKIQKSSAAEIVPVKTPAKLKHFPAETKTYLSGKHICIIFGYNYNDPDFVQKTRLQLASDYGIKTDDSDGLILTYVFPDDFMHSGKARVSQLNDLIGDTPLAGMIILGAPDGMNMVLARMEDNEGGKRSYPLFSLFPQDDVLGTESTADFVLDYAQKTDEVSSEETPFIRYDDIEGLLSTSIQTMAALRAPVPADQNLHTFVQKLIGPHKTVSRYSDGETGLQSENHFVIE